MTQEPKASIIVNNYNYGRFVGEAIESALAQSYPNVEVVVVDDGSTDNSREVIARYQDRVIAVLKENGGQASAFNAGFEVSTGDLIHFLDSDDVLEPDAIEIVVREWKDGLGRIFSPLRAIDARGKPLGKLVGGKIAPRALAGPYWGGSEFTSGNVFSRKVLEKVMPAPEKDWRISADIYLCAASSLFGEAVRLEQPLCRYRIHGRNNFYGEPESLARTRKNIHHHLNLYNGLVPVAGGRIGPLERWLGASPEHWMLRITSKRESPRDHPWPDTLAGLTVRAVKAAWRRPGWTFRRRLAYSLYAIPYGLLPGGERQARKGPAVSPEKVSS